MTFSPAAPPVAAPKTSGLAIASLICAILGCTAIVGLILGFVALSKIKKSGGQMTGRGLAIAAIVISALMLLVFVALAIMGLVAGMALPAIGTARDMAVGTQSMNNVKQLCRATEGYKGMNRTRFPAAQEWPKALEECLGSKLVITDPSDPSGGRAYAMNANLAGKPETNVVRSYSETVLFFECSPGAPPAGGRELLPNRPRHGRGYVIGFCDGHVEQVPPNEMGKLIWDPDSDAPK
jgi:prepilin-type processing-associated H-X9-DG protein